MKNYYEYYEMEKRNPIKDCFIGFFACTGLLITYLVLCLMEKIKKK